MASIYNTNSSQRPAGAALAEDPLPPQKKWWQSTNFWISAVMVILGAVIGFSEDIAEQVVGAVFGVIAQMRLGR